MAVYTASVTSPMKHAERLSRSLGIFVGKVNVTGYNASLVEITGITRYFVDIAHTGAQPVKYAKGVVSCTPCGASDNGHIFEWNSTDGSFKVYKPTTINMDSTIAGQVVQADAAGGTGFELHCTSATGSIYATATEVATDCDCGEVTFVAIGFVR